jgi:hypothetical protein
VIDAGYFAKRVVQTPDWLKAASVNEICSASTCISLAPDGWIDHWRHNEFGWFNRVSDAFAVVPPEQGRDFRLFAYRIYPHLFRTGARLELRVPSDVHPDPIPATFESLGFDSVNKSMATVLGFECSPLSCNSMATEMSTNEHCLFESLDAAVAGAIRFSIEQPEPGDYYVIEVLEKNQAAWAGISDSE